ncbi:MAG: hypothetical protein JRH11_13710 [Deltaproteobacteria bacterium]|nr:hypothetical protein [Deltaproteobacteria bacterium]
MQRVVIVVLVSVVVGCTASHGGPRGDAGGDSALPPLVATDELDLLFVVDNSGSMTEEQVSLYLSFPKLFADLSPLYDSIRVGFITTDMGTGGFGVPTCSEPNFGDDGVLRTTGNTAIDGCMASYPSFIEYTPASDDSASFALDAACIGVVGTGGCGIEQQLEAMLKAVTPSTQGPSGRFDGSFGMGTVGHADGINGGFLRPDADLAVVIVSEEGDCSALDPEIANPASSVYTGDYNLRCFRYPDALQPVERYTDGLLAGRDPRRLHYLLISGVPTDAIGTGFATILAHRYMQEQIDPDMPTRLRPSCNVAGRGFAFPPRRMVELGRQLEARGAAASIQSICQGDFVPPMHALVEMLR